MTDTPATPTKAFGINVKWLRQSHNFSQEALAMQRGIYRSYLSRIESGRANPTLMVIVAFAHSLGIDPHELLMDDNHTLTKAASPF